MNPAIFGIPFHGSLASIVERKANANARESCGIVVSAPSIPSPVRFGIHIDLAASIGNLVVILRNMNENICVYIYILGNDCASRYVGQFCFHICECGLKCQQLSSSETIYSFTPRSKLS